MSIGLTPLAHTILADDSADETPPEDIDIPTLELLTEEEPTKVVEQIPLRRSERVHKSTQKENIARHSQTTIGGWHSLRCLQYHDVHFSSYNHGKSYKKKECGVYALLALFGHPFGIYVLVINFNYFQHISNSLGAILGLVQLILYACYCSWKKGNNDDDPKMPAAEVQLPNAKGATRV
ncbi:hypothetical protein L6164_026066 [Bauhinia variegata]|uniref:Uncharacterized protein n=1 Tax=Bauhinia variegata TaxID=167791 RepID=A0ACB9M2G5_BAUVA|nr:hypothetical protein L6164_026066 [Bauhinia variegata]